MSFIRIAVLIFIATQAVQGAALQTVPYVDPAQYLGTWYQIARNPLFFERGCVCSRQVLSAEASGQIGIYNTCNDQTPTGRLQEIRGTAVNDDPATNARFTVDFGLPNKGQYWIIALDPQYRYAVVSDPSLKSLYILSKTPDLAAGLYDEAVKQAAAQVNTSQLQKTLQMGCNYPAPVTVASLPVAPALPAHPGSKFYPYAMNKQEIQCKGRAVTVYLPVSTDATEKFPAVVFGHGQALDVSYYSGTLEHLAKRGVAAIFPAYDSGFFDQDWARMGRDYVNVASCALDKFSNQIEKSQTVFAGHSKGAYVASIAAGISVQENLPLRARAVLLFDSAGFDSATISGIEPSTSLTVVYSDHDTIVDRSLSESIYSSAASQHKQFILLKSYPSLQADHFWPLTKASAFGGGAESALHYFGAWKWLVAAAWDLKSGGGFTNPYLYGDLAGDKGVPGFTDDIRRSWTAAPFVDAEVRAYLNSPSTPTFPVLVRYRSVPHPVRAQTRAAQESAMRQQTENQQNSVFHNLAMAAAQNLRPLWLVGGTLAELSAVQILQLLRDPLVESLSWSARPSALNLLPARFSQRTRNRFTYGLEHIGIPQQRANFPQINGAGIRVGYIDTGIDPAHPDLKGKVLAFRDFTTRAPVNASPYDDHGHGSHVAGTIAGGSSSGQAIGVAPGVGLIVAKAFGSYGGTEEGWLLAAMQWMADPDGDPATADFAQVVSNSWDSTTDTTKISPEESVFCVAVKNLLNLGIIPVVAAGNDGPGAGTIQVPAACPGAVAVAASNDADGIADFSSRGPVKWKNMSLAKPDVSAPGEDIESAAPGGGYATKSGTSMATPHVSGAVALLLQARPGADPATIRRILLDTAKDIAATGPDDESGAGLIDVDRATRRALGVN